MDWTEKQILDTLRLIEESDFDEVRLETADFKLHVRKSGTPAASVDVTPIASAPLRTETRIEPGRRDEGPTVPPGMVAIRAPMVGTFYRAPAPHLPPFVEMDANVKADDTVCLIEVMKLFNTIRAGVNGRVVEILAQNAATVKRDEVLILIEPLR